MSRNRHARLGEFPEREKTEYRIIGKIEKLYFDKIKNANPNSALCTETNLRPLYNLLHQFLEGDLK